MEKDEKQHYTQTANSLLLYNKWTMNIKIYYQEISNNVDKKKDNSGFYPYVIISES